MQFLLSSSGNRYGFTLAGYQNEKSATNPALTVYMKNIMLNSVSVKYVF